MRCSGARVLRTPSHVNESFTAAMVVRRRLAAECSSWVVGVFVGWVEVRLVVCWPVSWEVVVAVDMKKGVSVRRIEVVNEPDETGATKHLNARSD